MFRYLGTIFAAQYEKIPKTIHEENICHRRGLLRWSLRFNGLHCIAFVKEKLLVFSSIHIGILHFRNTLLQLIVIVGFWIPCEQS